MKPLGRAQVGRRDGVKMPLDFGRGLWKQVWNLAIIKHICVLVGVSGDVCVCAMGHVCVLTQVIVRS